MFENQELKQPVINIGVLSEFKEVHKDLHKIEKVIGHIGYIEERVFVNLPDINYTDSYVSFKGKLISVNLFDINSSEDIHKKLLAPALEMYRS